MTRSYKYMNPVAQNLLKIRFYFNYMRLYNPFNKINLNLIHLLDKMLYHK